MVWLGVQLQHDLSCSMVEGFRGMLITPHAYASWRNLFLKSSWVGWPGVKEAARAAKARVLMCVLPAWEPPNVLLQLMRLRRGGVAAGWLWGSWGGVVCC